MATIATASSLAEEVEDIVMTIVKQKIDFTRIQQEVYNTSSQLYTKKFKEDNISFRN